jgi:hypothetical protein
VALAAAGAPVPAVLGVASQVLVLERVGGPPDWPALGRAIARTTGDRVRLAKATALPFIGRC